MNPKLFALAILSTIFIFNSSPKAEGLENQAGKNQNQKMIHTEALAHSGTAGAGAVENGSNNRELHQYIKVPGSKVELDYWIRFKNQFLWSSAGNGSTLLPGTPGC